MNIWKEARRLVVARLAKACSSAALVVVALAGCAGDEAIAPELVAQNDHGVALMGRYEYAAAEQTFATVVDRAPHWLDARVNLAIATLNRQQEGDEQLALDILAQVLAEDAAHLRALYTSAVLHLYLGDAAQATAKFRQTALADPDDAYAAYFLGQSLLQQGDHAGAAEWLLKSAELAPYLRSAYWAGSQALRRLGRDEDAAALLADYQRFEDNPAALLAGFSYARMGPKASALAVTPTAPTPDPLPPGALFGAPVAVGMGSEPLALPALRAPALADIDGDGAVDAMAVAEDALVVFRNVADAHVSLPADPRHSHPLAGLGPVSAVLLGDMDNSGRIDIVLCAETGTRLTRQEEGGSWSSAALLGARPCRSGAVFDADHDGDLDVFTVGAEGNALYSDNRDGSYRELAEEMGLRGGSGRQALVVDLDGDRDLDILVINQAPPHDVWMNDRMWQYQPFAGLEDLQRTPLAAVTAADADADGRREIYGAGPGGAILRWRRNGAGWQREEVAAGNGSGIVQLDVADFDGDGGPDLLRVRSDGFAVIDPRLGRILAEHAADGIASAVAATLDAGRGPSVLAATADGMTLWPPGPGRHGFLALTLSGRNEAAEMRSNASGIGTVAEVRVAGRWTVLDVLDAHSGPSQSAQPLAVGLGGYDAADFVELTWPDGVTQTELALAAGERHAIVETQRELASCPVFFAWDGERYRFVSDVLGGAALGYLAAPGVYTTPRPVESYLLGADALAPKDGAYRIKLAEPMEENAYLDAARLTVYDLPPGWSMALDERLAVGGEIASGRPIYFREAQGPATVTTRDGADATEFAIALDRRAVPPGPRDGRFIGLLTDTQILTMTFETPLPETNAVLVADAWVEFPYSQTAFAAWQAGRRYEAPTLEARGGDGRWQTIAAEFGYPGGMPRTMALPLPRLPAGTTALRLKSNIEIYWDRLRVVREEPLEATVRTLTPNVGRVARSGFPKRTTGAQRLPHYDYETRATYDDAKVPRGFYTAWGDALPLVADVDGALAIIGSGEEVHLEFPAVPPPAENATRYFEVRFHGWAKDMDLYTKDGDTVGPLPVLPGLDEAALARRDALHARYNLRWQGGL